ncbi:hypothetical protein NKH18_08515 [Streptomyces sp. M10(2022)]
MSAGGRSGYLVRWQVTTGKGPGLRAVAGLPSASGSETPVIVRFAFDAGGTSCRSPSWTPSPRASAPSVTRRRVAASAAP